MVVAWDKELMLEAKTTNVQDSVSDYGIPFDHLSCQCGQTVLRLGNIPFVKGPHRV